MAFLEDEDEWTEVRETDRDEAHAVDMLDAVDVKDMCRELYSRDKFERGKHRLVVQRGDKWGNRSWRRNRKVERKLHRSEHHAARNQARFDMTRLSKFVALKSQAVFQKSTSRF